MIYLATLGHDGRVKIQSYRGLNYFLSVAGQLYCVPNTGDVQAIAQAAGHGNKYAGLFMTEWLAVMAIHRQEVPDTVATKLFGEIRRHQKVAARNKPITPEASTCAPA